MEKVGKIGSKKEPLFVASCDQEAWVCARIENAIDMADLLKAARGVSANNAVCRMGVRGIVQGTAIEIMRILGGEPGFVNIAKPPWPKDS